VGNTDPVPRRAEMTTTGRPATMGEAFQRSKVAAGLTGLGVRDGDTVGFHESSEAATGQPA
jgi:hypothetical protein